MMKLSIRAQLDYSFDGPCEALLQLEAAALPEQRVIESELGISPPARVTKVPATDGIGERCWVRVERGLVVDYRAIVLVERPPHDCADLAATPLSDLPPATIPYLMASRYCPSDQFQTYVDADFAGLEGGRRIVAMRDWIHRSFTYDPAASTSHTTATDSFVRRQGICRDYAHVMIALARAAGIPARIASVYGHGVDPPDFHAVADVFLGGAWHLVDATGMAGGEGLVRIGVGRDAADVAFLSTYGKATMNSQSVAVERLD